MDPLLLVYGLVGARGFDRKSVDDIQHSEGVQALLMVHGICLGQERCTDMSSVMLSADSPTSPSLVYQATRGLGKREVVSVARFLSPCFRTCKAGSSGRRCGYRCAAAPLHAMLRDARCPLTPSSAACNRGSRAGRTKRSPRSTPYPTDGPTGNCV